MSELTALPAWQALAQHRHDMDGAHMRDLFAQDPLRFDRFSLRFGDILFDYSKNRITEETMSLLLDLADASRSCAARSTPCSAGEKINTTEEPCRAARRSAQSQQSAHCGRRRTMSCPRSTGCWSKMRLFSEGVRSGEWRGYTGKAHHRRRQHRHRRLGPGPQDGDARR